MAATSPPKRRTPARKPVIEDGAGDPVPLDPEPIYRAVDGTDEVLRFTSPDQPVEEERVVVAYLDDYPLTVPKTVPPNIALKVMRTSRTRGDEIAMMQMLEEVIGPEGYERLANWPSLTIDNLVDLFKAVQKVSMGALEIPKSSSRNG